MKTSRLNIRVTDELKESCEYQAELDGVSLAAWVIRVLTRELRNAARREG